MLGLVGGLGGRLRGGGGGGGGGGRGGGERWWEVEGLGEGVVGGVGVWVGGGGCRLMLMTGQGT